MKCLDWFGRFCSQQETEEVPTMNSSYKVQKWSDKIQSPSYARTTQQIQKIHPDDQLTDAKNLHISPNSLQDDGRYEYEYFDCNEQIQEDNANQIWWDDYNGEVITTEEMITEARGVVLYRCYNSNDSGYDNSGGENTPSDYSSSGGVNFYKRNGSQSLQLSNADVLTDALTKEVEIDLDKNYDNSEDINSPSDYSSSMVGDSNVVEVVIDG